MERDASNINEEILKKIKELSVPILKTITPEEIQNFKPYYERYYESKYCTSFNTGTANNDMLLKCHTNRLILICLAQGHDIVRHNKHIEKINFVVDGVDMCDITVSGKKKAGAKRLKKQSILCNIKCVEEEQEYPIYTCIPASLIEVNHLIFDNPQLLVSDSNELGYIGVLYPQCYGPNASSIDKMISKQGLLSKEEYLVYLSKRNEEMNHVNTINKT